MLELRNALQWLRGIHSRPSHRLALMLADEGTA